MNGWTADELDAIGASEELEISTLRADGTAHRFVPIWVVGLDGALYIRSSHGPESGWFRRAASAPHVIVRAGGVQREVVLRVAAPSATDIDRAYRDKYAVIGAAWIGDLLSPLASSTTREIVPTA
ncbi:DUF2255 family protein [Herbiconiux sp. CPCC 205716]|uniref:DUF2255 family protein n=1 Tax=Herbiconiux gentiana TaxID=2970912 RepID=A0ABT2GD86_9MICO|nr:DUF2255 family protein [Herbiconiux gentiana]MCS5714189.1 DUF2255 family protein [Herbiconiux gentiana]